MPTLLVVGALIGGRLLVMICLSFAGVFLADLDLDSDFDLEGVRVFLFFGERVFRFLGDDFESLKLLFVSLLGCLGEDLEYGLLRAPLFFVSNCDSSL